MMRIFEKVSNLPPLSTELSSLALPRHRVSYQAARLPSPQSLPTFFCMSHSQSGTTRRSSIYILRPASTILWAISFHHSMSVEKCLCISSQLRRAISAKLLSVPCSTSFLRIYCPSYSRRSHATRASSLDAPFAWLGYGTDLARWILPLKTGPSL